MRLPDKWSPGLVGVGLIFLFWGCSDTPPAPDTSFSPPDTLLQIADTLHAVEVPKGMTMAVARDVYVRDYFRWIHALVDSVNAHRNDPLDEYILAHANPWIIDSLRHTDYYFLRDERGIQSLDPTAHRLIEQGRELLIPDSAFARKIQFDLDHTWLDLNIPEFSLRIVQQDSVIATFPVRVGRNERRYLAMAGREVDLRTKPGVGRIVRVNREPVFINPRDNRRYSVTRRDDDVVTKLPNIPWLEPEVDGIRIGQLIHPTTNLSTLGKASSNGCIGLRESDAWSVYFFAPLGTEIIIRYDLVVEGPDGEPIHLPHIYPGFEHKRVQRRELLAAREALMHVDTPSCFCGKVH
jgi:hypothetical protein